VSAPHELLSGGAILARDGLARDGLAREGAERADGWGESATRAAGRDESCGRVSAVGAAQSDSGGSAQSDGVEPRLTWSDRKARVVVPISQRI